MSSSRTVVDESSGGEFVQLLNNSPAFKDMQEKWAGVLYLFPFLFHDVFSALYEETPKILLPEVTSAGSRLNRLVLEQLMKSSEYKRVRQFTRQNRRGAGMIAIYFGEMICQGLNEGLVEIANEIFITEEELADALLEGQVAEKIAAIAHSENKCETVELYQASLGWWNELAGQKRNQLKSLSARLSIQWNASGKKGIAGTGSGHEGDKQGKFATGVEGLGNNKGVWATGDLTPHLQAVETYLASPKLKQLAQRVGRLKQVRELKRGPALPEDSVEVRGINYGNDLVMVTPEEWLDYFQPVKRVVFYKKFADESLCMFDVQGKHSKGAGSLIICLDNSGSMQGPKEETAKAIAIALMEIAMAQHRDFVIIMFGGPEDEMKIFEIPLGHCTFDQLIEIGEYFLCSAGTDFEKPLNAALKYLDKDKYPDGDIIFITDGVCQVSTGFQEKYGIQKKSKHFRTIGVLVNYGQVSRAPMEAFCDEILWSKDLRGIDIAGELFGKVRSGYNQRGRN